MSRIIDERGRIFGKVNVVDILVFLVIVAVIVFAVTRLTGTSAQTVPVTVEYTMEEVREATVVAVGNAAKKGDRVTDDSGTFLGEIAEIRVMPTQEEYFTSGDELKVYESPLFSEIVIRIVGKGTIISGRSARIGSVQLAVGKPVTLKGPGYEVKTMITLVDF